MSMIALGLNLALGLWPLSCRDITGYVCTGPSTYGRVWATSLISTASGKPRAPGRI